MFFFINVMKITIIFITVEGTCEAIVSFTKRQKQLYCVKVYNSVALTINPLPPEAKEQVHLSLSRLRNLY